MNAPHDIIAARNFKPKRLSGFIWRSLKFIGPSAASRYLDHVVRARVRKVRRAGPQRGGPISMIGAFALNIGLGRAAQILCSSLEASGLPVHTIDCSTVLRPPAGGRPPLPPTPAQGTLVFCVNAPEMVPLLRRFGPRICTGKRLIGYWWWELDRVPRDWLPWAKLLDEIWVSSRFIQETFQRALPGKAIRYVPLPVPEPVPSQASRRDLGLAKDRFTVLVAFDLASRWERKNPLGAIAAFQRAFPDADQAQLVLKVGGAHVQVYADQLEQLRALTAEMPNLRIIDGDLAANDLAALIKCSDVLLSLHRSEGLGLFIAEAMWLGTPVVATGWSGVMDMLDDTNAMLVRYRKIAVLPTDYPPSVPPGAQWADPDIDHAAQCLKRLAEDPALRTMLRTKARARAEQLFSLDRFRELAPSLLQPLVGKE